MVAAGPALGRQAGEKHMILPSIPHLLKFLDTLQGRDEDDHVTVTMAIGDLRILAEGKLTTDNAPEYTSKDVIRR